MDMLAPQDISPRKRTYRTVAEKRRIVELAMQEDRSVALVARQEGINANQLFCWRREYLAGLLTEDEISSSSQIIPVNVVDEEMPQEENDPSTSTGVVTDTVLSLPASTPRGSVHIGIERGCTSITAEFGADPELLRIALEVLRR